MFKFHLRGPHNLKMLITLADAYLETVGIGFPCYHSHKFSIEPKTDFKQTHAHRHIKKKMWKRRHTKLITERKTKITKTTTY